MRNTLMAALGRRNLVGALVPAMALALSLMLAACGGAEGSGTISSRDGQLAYLVDRERADVIATFTSPDGDRMILNSGAGASVLLPEGFGLHRMAHVLSSTSLSRRRDLASIVLFTREASVGQVLAHHRRQAEAAGMAVIEEDPAAGWRMLSAQGAGGLMMHIAARPGADGAVFGRLTMARQA